MFSRNLEKRDVENRKSRLLDRILRRGRRAEEYEQLQQDGIFFRPSDTLDTPTTQTPNRAFRAQEKSLAFLLSHSATAAPSPMTITSRVTSSTLTPASSHPLEQRDLTKPLPQPPTQRRQPLWTSTSQPTLRDEYNLRRLTARNLSSIDLGVISGAAVSSKLKRLRHKTSQFVPESKKNFVKEKLTRIAETDQRDSGFIDTCINKADEEELAEDCLEHGDIVEIGRARLVFGVIGRSRTGEILRRVLVGNGNTHDG